MLFKVHFYVALFLLNSYTVSSTFGTRAKNNLTPNETEHNSNNNGNNNNSGTVARSNSDVMETGPNHSNNDSSNVYAHQAIEGQQDTAFIAVASIKMTKEFGHKNFIENKRGNFTCTDRLL